MNLLMIWVLSNLAVALVLALVACAADRCFRRPALTHSLWVLVLLKLITPPVFSIPVLRTTIAEPVVAIAQAKVADLVAMDALPAPLDGDGVPEVPAAPQEPEPDAAAPVAESPAPALATLHVATDTAGQPDTAFSWHWLPSALGCAWLGGAGIWFLLASVRLLRFRRVLRLGQPASADLQQMASNVAERLEVTCPPLLMVPGAISPMLWVFGRDARLVLPASLGERLSPEQWRMLLAHELAHWRRRDHWIRWLELAVLGLYWWCPLVWWAQRRLQHAEEECCDAWVISIFPETARDYALALVETLDFLSGARAALPPAASGLGHVQLLRRRLTMILRGQTPRALSLMGLLAVMALGALLLPLAPTWAQVAPPAVRQDDAREGQQPRKGADNSELDKARREIQRLQEELARMKQQMEQRRREFEDKLQNDFAEKQENLMKEIQEANKRAAARGFAGGGGRGAGFPGAGAPGAQPGGAGPGASPGVQPGRSGPGGMPGGGFQGGGFPGGGFGGGPGFGGGLGGQQQGRTLADVERRLSDLERKLDRVIDRLEGGGAPKGVPLRPQDPNAPPGAGPGRFGPAGVQPPPATPPPPATQPKTRPGFGADPANPQTR